MSLPGQVRGRHRAVSWLNRTRDEVQANRLVSGPGIRIRRSTTGTVIEAIALGGGGRSAAAALTMYKIRTLQNDYVVARTWDGTTRGETDTNIAKPPNFRLTFTEERIDGFRIRYSYQDSNNRTANDGTNSEAQVCFPRYIVDDATYNSDGTIDTAGVLTFEHIIYAMQVENGTGVSAASDWIEVKPARVWARRYIQ